MSITVRKCTGCGAKFYCGRLTCTKEEAERTVCYCVKCSLASDESYIKQNIKKCPKANTLEEIISLTTIEVL